MSSDACDVPGVGTGRHPAHLARLYAPPGPLLSLASPPRTMSAPQEFTFYMDVVSPWTYIAYIVLQRYRKPWNLDLVRWLPVCFAE